MAGSYGLLSSLHLVHWVILAQWGQADWWAESSLPQIILIFKVANSSPGLCALFDIFLIQSILIPENFLLNSILSPNVIVHLCGQPWSMWLHLGPWDTSLGNGRFRTRQGIGTSAINPEKDNARFFWLLVCDLWMCERSLNLLEDFDERNVV